MSSIKTCIMGYIVGDVYGLSILNNECNDIKLNSNSVLNIEKGYYSSLTTFMLATMDSISKLNGVKTIDITNKMCKSLIVGSYTNSGKVYDVNKNTIKILDYYRIKGNLNYNYDDNDMSMWSVSNLIPVILFNKYKSDSFENILSVVSILNNNDIVLLGCYIYYKFIINILDGKDKYDALKIDIPDYFNKKDIKVFKNIIKGNIYYKDIVFDDNVINVLNIVFYVILNSDNMIDILRMISNLSGNTNLYSSLIIMCGSIMYGIDSIPSNIINGIKNKRDINKYIREFERILI